MIKKMPMGKTLINMMPILAAITLLTGGLMLATKARRRFPCFAGGLAAIIAGGFTLSLPIIDSLDAIGWIWFCGWLISLPIMLGCSIGLLVILQRDRSVLPALILCSLAFLSSIPSAVSYWMLTGLGIVEGGSGYGEFLSLHFWSVHQAAECFLQSA